MNINDTVYWNVNRRVDVKVGRDYSGRIYSDICDKVWSGDVQGIEQEVVNELGSGYDITINKYDKGVKSWVSVEVGDNVGWGDDRSVDFEVDMSVVKKLFLGNKSRLCSSDSSFCGFHVGNDVRFIDWSMTWKNDLPLLYLSDIDRYLVDGVIKSVGWTIGRSIGGGLFNNIGDDFESFDDVAVKLVVWADFRYIYGSIVDKDVKGGVNLRIDDSVG